MKVQGTPVSRRRHASIRWYGCAVFAVAFLASLQFAQMPALDITPLSYHWEFILLELGCIVPMLALMLRLRRRVG